MAEWQTSTSSADQYSVWSSAENRMDTRGGTRDTSGAGSYGVGEYSVVGINGGRAREAADRLYQSTKRIMDRIKSNEMNQNLLNGAVKGTEVQESLRKYVENVKSYCAAVVSDLNAFADKLYEVSRVWEESQRTYATNTIDESATSSFSGSTTEEYRVEEAQTSMN